MSLPWETLCLDPTEEQLSAAEVSFTAWIQLSCDAVLAPHIRADFTWFTATGELAEPVDSGPCSGWELVGSASVEPRSSLQSQSGRPDDLEACFSKVSPAVQATCKFVRELPNLKLSVRLRLPESLEQVRADTAAATKAQETAAPQAPPPGKGKAPAKTAAAAEPATPSYPFANFEAVLQLAPLVVLGHCGGPAEIQKDFTAMALQAKLEGLGSLVIGVRCSTPVLSPELVDYLNPLLITLDGVHRLPQEEHIGQRREGVYAVVDAFGERRRTGERALNAQGAASFNMHSVFFTGVWHQRQLREYLQTNSFAVELHDREEPPPEPPVLEVIPAKPPSREADPAAKAKAKAGAKGSRPPTGASDGKPPPVGGEGEEPPAADAVTPAVAPYGLARFCLAELLGPFLRTWRHLRSTLAPQLGPSQKGNLGKGTVKVPMLFGPGSKEVLASQKALSFEFVPRYAEHGSFISITFGIAGPIKQRNPKVIPAPVQTVVEAPPSPVVADPKAKAKGKAKAKAKAEPKPESPPPVVEVVEEPPDKKPPRHEIFARLVLVTDYRRTTMMKRLLALVREQNSKALELDEGQSRTIAAIELTDEQKQDRQLDILTGFCVMDRYTRVTVVEGLREGSMKRVTEVLETGRARASSKCKILFHEDVGFSERLYLDFKLSIKQIKLRQSSLEKLMHRPDLYDRALEDKEVVAAIGAMNCLMEMKRAQRLHSLKAISAFPSSEGILSIETLYGDFVADEELAGGKVDDTRSTKSGRSQSKSGGGRSHEAGFGPLDQAGRSESKALAAQAADKEENIEKPPASDSESDADDLGHTRSARVTLKAPTNTRNARFARTLKKRAEEPTPSMLERNMTIVRDVSHENASSRPKKKPDQAFLDGIQVHIYSSQTYNTAELQKKQLRKRFEEQQHVEFGAYNHDFNSGCFPMLEKDINLNDVLRQSVAFDDGRHPWRYPKPREKSEYRKPDRDISDARKEELSCAWVENELRPGLEPKDVVTGSFDMKTLGTGGRHVLNTRRPGHQEPVDPPPPPKVQPAAPMRYGSGYASMNLPAPVDKYTTTVLDGNPTCRAIDFGTRSTPRSVTQKFGTGQSVANVGVPPVSLNKEEEFQERDKGNSEYPHQFAVMCARPVVPRTSLVDGATASFKSARGFSGGTAQSWTRTLGKPVGDVDRKKSQISTPDSPGATATMFGASATGPMSARGARSKGSTARTREWRQAMPMSAR